ncbi:ribose 5-phosphate isomerase A, partial [Acinetobacter baumannii]|nr:ribose 5-phosphate isomerase A [Acinetobacter baumannii]
MICIAGTFPLSMFYNAPPAFTSRTRIMTQDELKKAVGWAALQ